MSAPSDILETIVARRRLDVAEARARVPESALRERATAAYPGPPLDLYKVLRRAPGLAVAAEFKRASPSKGDMVSPDSPVAPQARAYTLGGASVLSILTEPTWFKGSLEDLECARVESERAARELGLPAGRPALLRKEFVIDAYQLLEARAYGADTVLLIVSCLPTVALLRPLIDASRALGMEPLVEVNSVEELDVALEAGSRCVGINNRNLRTFTVDLGTTVRVVAAAAAAGRTGGAQEPIAILSLSGLRSPADVASLIDDCVAGAGGIPASSPSSSSPSVSPVAVLPPGLTVMRGFLIGEALMRSADPQDMVRSLVDAGKAAYEKFAGAGAEAAGRPAVENGASASSSSSSSSSASSSASSAALTYAGRVAASVSAKVCGIKHPHAAVHAARSGADLVGVIMVRGSPRGVDVEGARAITSAVRAFREQDPSGPLARLREVEATQGLPASAVDGPRLARAAGLLRLAIQRARPLTVGVFMDAPPAEVAAAAAGAGFDLVQLHGDEDPAAFAAFPFPLVKVVHVPVGGGSGGGGGGGDGGFDAAAVAARIASWSRVASALLIDSKASGGGASGGTGASFDHTAVFAALDGALRACSGVGGEGGEGEGEGQGEGIPLLLAGGLTPTSVGSVLATLRADDEGVERRTTGAAAVEGGSGPSSSSSTPPPLLRVWGVDVSSGVEHNPEHVIGGNPSLSARA
jgi:anthranilate synthase / indole-3-glycerol phosphate synthase / phosphoribosylanthranilate isomerase